MKARCRTVRLSSRIVSTVNWRSRCRIVYASVTLRSPTSVEAEEQASGSVAERRHRRSQPGRRSGASPAWNLRHVNTSRPNANAIQTAR